MSAFNIGNLLENAAYDQFCDRLPRDLDYGGPDDSEELIVTDGNAHYEVEIMVTLAQVQPCERCEQWHYLSGLTEEGICRSGCDLT